MEPVELLARLAALVPPPRYPELRYSGVLAPNEKWRPVVVPTLARERTRARRCSERTEKTGASEGQVAVRIDAVPWAGCCDGCTAWTRSRAHGAGGRMRVIAVLVDASTAQRARARDPSSG